ncbi:restriction endonuclease subunit S [Mesomycoplasma hyorhinis]|uniref:restriction endonuclease subunit S n=1 Tax=Mesomycoplasma hyorhinis TaxID=2100 RepID=UPI001C69343F|nr:restriction endonuclease subunit S [Mesomycoplasma hyorhinis]
MFELDGGGFVSKYEIQNNPGKYPVYSSQTTNNGTMGYISSYKYDLECLTWTTRGYAGVVFYRNEKFSVSNSGLLIFKRNIIYNYRYFLFVFQMADIQKSMTEGNIPQFTVEMMKEAVLTYSNNLNEQRKISQLFYTLDKIISLYERKISLLEKIEKALLDNMFIKENEEKPSIRFLGFNSDWQSWTLEDKGYLYSGLNSKTKVDFTNGNSKYITYLNVFNNFNIDLKEKSLVFIKSDEKQNSIVKGDILFTMSSETYQEVGMSSAVTEEVNEKIYLNSFCFGYRLNKADFLFPNFSAFLFRNHSVRHKIILQSNGGTSRFNLSKKSFLNLKIKSPQIQEQQQISSLLDKVHLTHTQLKRKLNLIKNIQKSVLNKMFV